MKKMVLKAKRTQAIRRQHPWIFSGAIQEEQDNPQDGERVEVCSHKGEVLGVGHYQDGSIRVRVFHFGDTPIPADIWEQKFRDARSLREWLAFEKNDTNCYRLIHAEGDGCPGLVVDIYGSIAIVQCHSWGMYQEKEAIAEALSVVFGDQLQAVYCKSQSALPKRFRPDAKDAYLIGDGGPSEVKENGHAFHIDWAGGQKTGFFLDQRENRALLARYAAGRKVLNTFCYTGGFSVYALAAGAEKVDSVDVSAKAMAITEQNLRLNGFSPEKNQCITQDALAFLKESTDQYDIVVVDPPAFAKAYAKRHNAVQGYKRLNVQAIQRIRPGGLLFTFSCSQVVDRQLFYDTIVAAGMESGRKVQVMHQLTQGPDHPVSLFHPEGEYLKGLVLKVD